MYISRSGFQALCDVQSTITLAKSKLGVGPSRESGGRCRAARRNRNVHKYMRIPSTVRRSIDDNISQEQTWGWAVAREWWAVSRSAEEPECTQVHEDSEHCAAPSTALAAGPTPSFTIRRNCRLYASKLGYANDVQPRRVVLHSLH